MDWYQKMCNNPHNNPVVLMTECCEANFNAIPACFGEPEMYLCAGCKKITTKILRKPVFEKIRNGVYRPIVYPNVHKI